MYKCKECGSEFDIKPDFCDCGNDEFEEVTEIPASPQPSPQQIKETKNSAEIKPENKPIPEIKKSFEEQYPEISRLKNSLDPISVVIFSVCIILSLLVIFFAWNPKEVSEQTETEVQETVKNIPSINKIWNSAVPKIAETKPVETPVKITPVQIKPTVKAPVQIKPVQQKTQTVQKPKTTTVKLTKNPAVSTAAQTKAQEKAKLEAQEKARLQAQEKAKQEAAQKALKAQQEAQHKAQQQAIAKQEFNNYKAALRNTLGRKIDFTQVVGDGDCIVAFKLSSSGNLINRSFAKQSSNITLNDAVYKAVMSTPSYNPPPSAYKGETLNLYIKFYNGNFEISLK